MKEIKDKNFHVCMEYDLFMEQSSENFSQEMNNNSNKIIETIKKKKTISETLFNSYNKCAIYSNIENALKERNDIESKDFKNIINALKYGRTSQLYYKNKNKDLVKHMLIEIKRLLKLYSTKK
jgi:hypothetical protein